MSILLSAAQAAVICVTTWFLWKYFRQIVVKSPLDNIPGPPSGSFWLGNVGQMFARNGWKFHQDVLEGYGGPVVKLHGMAGHKMLYVYDPKALHSIIVRDSYVYEEPAWLIEGNLLVFGPGLLSTLGDHHRKQRKMLNPVFSVAHMRYMLPIFIEVSHKLRDAIASRVQKGQEEIDVLNWMGRTALELIGQGGMGYCLDPLTADTADELANAAKDLMPALYRVAGYRRMTPYFAHIGPPAFRRWVMAMFPNKNVQELQKIVDTLYSKSKELFEIKKAALEKGDDSVLESMDEGKDIISILLKDNMKASSEDKLQDEEIIGQMCTLIFAGTDTTSSALSQILHALSEHPEVQEKLRTEIIEALNGSDHLPYDELISLPYLDAVCRETLRLFAPLTMIFRETRKDVVLPLSEPVRGIDGTLMHEIPIPKDTSITVGIWACNRNKAIWGEDAEEWKPERWLSPLPSSVENAHVPGVYANLMTFSGGARSCIGFKFSQLEMKIVLVTLLSTFKFEVIKDKPIVWNIAGVKYPTVGFESSKAEMPLKVTML